MSENAITTITKYAMTVGSKVWREVIQYKNTNIASGFISTGMYTLYLTAMQF